MFVYFIPPVVSFVAAVFNQRLPPIGCSFLYFLTTFLAIFIYCGVHINGTDWTNYQEIFYILHWSNLVSTSLNYNFELGFCIVMLCFKSIGCGFFSSLILMKGFSLLAISDFFRRYASKYGQGYSSNVFLFLLIFYLGNCMYLYVETITRFSMALAIVVYSYKYLLNKNLIPYVCFISLACTIHLSAIIMLPIYFIRKIPFSNKHLVIFFALLLILLTPEIIYDFFSLLEGVLPSVFYIYLKGYMEVTIAKGVNIWSIGNVVHLFFLLICLLRRTEFITKYKYGNLLFTYLILYFILYYVTVYMGSIGRLSLYLRPVFIVVFVGMLSLISMKKVFVLFLVLLYLVFGMRNIISETESFLPYTNYLIYKTGEIGGINGL